MPTVLSPCKVLLHIAFTLMVAHTRWRRLPQKFFLESLPASSIKKVEVITHPDNRFGADSQRYILNIVLKQPMLEGYVVNLSAGGNTQPTANGSLMGMIKKTRLMPQ